MPCPAKVSRQSGHPDINRARQSSAVWKSLTWLFPRAEFVLRGSAHSTPLTARPRTGTGSAHRADFIASALPHLAFLTRPLHPSRYVIFVNLMCILSYEVKSLISALSPHPYIFWHLREPIQRQPSISFLNPLCTKSVNERINRFQNTTISFGCKAVEYQG